MSTAAPPIQRALISVFDKSGVVELARGLSGMGIEIISTGGTASLLRESDVEVIDISEVTGFPEMMDGRVKTLHPRVHGGLLMRRDLEHHVSAADEQGIRPIDLVVVNLYPFSDVISKPNATDEDAIEMIDIGGPSMVRSAAKNHAFVTVVTDPADYPDLLEALQNQDGATTLDQRRHHARRAFATTSAYDATIAGYLAGEDLLPEVLNVSFKKKHGLRYGENPHQDAAVYVPQSDPEGASVAWSKVHSGKEMSFNNYLDAHGALECVKSLRDVGCVVIKHKNPCGAAEDLESQVAAFQKAYEGDPLSAFGGIVAFNSPLQEDVAREMATKDKFFEVVVAPGYEGDSLEILQTGAKWGKNVRLLEVDPVATHKTAPAERELRWIHGGMLVQVPDWDVEVDFEPVTSRAPSDAELADLRFVWTICRHVTSNAIVYGRNRQLVAAGAGQMSRVDAVELAARKGGDRCQGAVMASDAFFPFDDGIRAAHAAGITAVVQPGGSIRDKKIIASCDELDVAMVLTGKRHFRH